MAEEVAKKPESFYCSNCKEYKVLGNEQDVLRQVIDFSKAEDGKAVLLKVSEAKRFALFCKKCQKFFGIVDPEAKAALEKFIQSNQK